jgi:hypothetical protein
MLGQIDAMFSAGLGGIVAISGLAPNVRGLVFGRGDTFEPTSVNLWQ